MSKTEAEENGQNFVFAMTAVNRARGLHQQAHASFRGYTHFGRAEARTEGIAKLRAAVELLEQAVAADPRDITPARKLLKEVQTVLTASLE
jgi:hypothetical protein